MAGQDVGVLQWLIDTRDLFPSATKTKHLETLAHPYLALLPHAERASTLKYHFPRDAKLSLASSLVKRHVISLSTTLPWSASAPTRDPQGKPVFPNPTRPVSFNVSHQDGLVALFAVTGLHAADVGVDIVSCAERRDRDREAVKAAGWPAFVDVYESVYSPGEMAYLKGLELPGGGAAPGDDDVVDKKLRYFYALWCLKEAYVKMTGEALLADWLRALEFRNFRPPAPAPGGQGRACDLAAGEVVRGIEVLRAGVRDEGVRMELRALGEEYMVGVSVRTPGRPDDAFGFELGDFDMVSLEEIRERAEQNP